MLCKGGLAGTIMSQDSHKAALFYIHIQTVNGPVHFFYILFLVAPDILIDQSGCFYDSHMFSLASIYCLRFSIVDENTIEVKYGT